MYMTADDLLCHNCVSSFASHTLTAAKGRAIGEAPARTGPGHSSRRSMGRLGRFFRDGMLQHVGREMENLQPSALYNAPDFELLAPFIDALQPATLMEARDQDVVLGREAVDPSGGRPRDAVSSVDVQEEVFTIQPADSRALGQPLSPPTVACRPARAPAPSSGIVWYAAVARGDVRPPGRDGGAQQREKTIDRIGFSLRL